MIRKASINDAESIAVIGKQTFYDAHEHSSPKEELESYLQTKFSTEQLRLELSDEKNSFHLIYFENELAGYSKVIYNTPAPQIPENTNVCKLERIYVLKKFYDKKIGLKLLKFNNDLCLQNQQLAMWLSVWTENERAIRFYEKFGFKTIGEIMFKVGNQYNPNLVMWLEL